MSRKPTPPGVMLYFEIRKQLARLSQEEKGMLFEAILEYAHYGTLPSFETQAASEAFAEIRPKLDADKKRYQRIKRKKRGGF